jgi:hypothetical protein
VQPRTLRIKRVAAVAVTLALGVAAASAFAAGSDEPTSTADGADASTSKPVPPASVAPVPPPPLRMQIQSLIGSERFSETYGGTVVQQDGRMHIYVVNDGLPAMRSALLDTFGSSATDAYVLEAVRHSEADLEALTMRIARDDAWQEHNGIRLAGWGPDPVSSIVRIEVPGYTPAIAEQLRERYGSDWVRVAPYTGPLPHTLPLIER